MNTPIKAEIFSVRSIKSAKSGKDFDICTLILPASPLTNNSRVLIEAVFAKSADHVDGKSINVVLSSRDMKLSVEKAA